MSLPSNVHISSHPCLQVKLSQLRSKSTHMAKTRRLVREMTNILGVEALAASLSVIKRKEKDTTLEGFDYEKTDIDPSNIAIVPVLRSGLEMVDAINELLPSPVPIYHYGLYREPTNCEPVEYYNIFPTQDRTAKNSLVILLDPVIATGGKAVAAIQTLREWGAQRVVMLSLLGFVGGVQKVANEWPEGTEFWIGAVDEQLTDQGMIKPGFGDIENRLFMEIEDTS